MKLLLTTVLAVLFCVPTVTWGAIYTETIENSCILYLRLQKGIQMFGDADKQRPNLKKAEATAGDVIIFDYPNGGAHVAYIEGLVPNGFWVSESNKIKGKLTARVVSKNDPYIVGYWRDPYVRLQKQIELAQKHLVELQLLYGIGTSTESFE